MKHCTYYNPDCTICPRRSAHTDCISREKVKEWAKQRMQYMANVPESKDAVRTMRLQSQYPIGAMGYGQVVALQDLLLFLDKEQTK